MKYYTRDEIIDEAKEEGLLSWSKDPVRLWHKYTAEGLLPHPHRGRGKKRGRKGTFSPQVLSLFKSILKFKAAGLSLPAIRDLLERIEQGRVNVAWDDGTRSKGFIGLWRGHLTAALIFTLDDKKPNTDNSAIAFYLCKPDDLILFSDLDADTLNLDKAAIKKKAFIFSDYVEIILDTFEKNWTDGFPFPTHIDILEKVWDPEIKSSKIFSEKKRKKSAKKRVKRKSKS